MYLPLMYNLKIFGSNELKRQKLRKVYDKIIACRKCPGLNQKTGNEHTLCIPGRGSANAKLMFVGQSNARPQAQFNKDRGSAPNVPFLYGSGMLLNALLGKLGLDRTEIYISNVVKAHPPGNRPSTDQEKINCGPFLEQELEIIKPRVVVSLGKDAYEYFLEFSERFYYGRDLFNVFSPKNRDFYFIPMYHPSFVQYKQTQDEQDRYLYDGNAAIRKALSMAQKRVSERSQVTMEKYVSNPEDRI